MSSAADVERTVTRLLAVQFGEDEAALRPDTRLADDLGADSLAVAELTAGIEDQFGIELPDTGPELAELVTLGDLVRAVEERLGAPDAGR